MQLDTNIRNRINSARLAAVVGLATTVAALAVGTAQAQITASPWGPPQCPNSVSCAGITV